MTQRDEFEVALSRVLAAEDAPEGFADRTLAKLAVRHPEARENGPFFAHFTWIVALRGSGESNSLLSLGLSSTPGPAKKRNRWWLGLASMGLHAGALAALVLMVFHVHPGGVVPREKPLAVEQAESISVPPFRQMLPLNGQAMHGGGGGGNRERLPAVQAALPAVMQEARISPDKQPAASLPQIAMPAPEMSAILGAAGAADSSSVQRPLGSGYGGGAGTGVGGGVGPGRGKGIGAGSEGGWGGGVYQMGSGATLPAVIHSVDPDFTEEARRNKYQGECVVALVVDEHGLPQNIHVVRHLGMGLDEKAVEAVREFRFKPSTFQGKPVKFATQIVVDFHIY